MKSNQKLSPEGKIFKTCASLLGALSLFCTSINAEEIPPGLKENDTICFYGDSITHQNLYIEYLTLFYATRYPQVKVRIYNAGVGGNRIATGLMRFRQDITEQKPKIVAFVFGMNDGNYDMFQANIFDAYKKGLDTIIERLCKELEGTKLILLTPPIFDYSALLKREKARNRTTKKSPLYNQTLMIYGDYLKKTGFEKGFPVIDINTSMLEALNFLRLGDAEAKFHEDGIHPLENGHFVIFQTLVKGFGATPLVSTLSIDASNKEFNTVRCELSNLTVSDNKIEFELLEEALPFPLSENLAAIAKTISFADLANQEIILLKNLPDGNYTLSIDGVKAGTYSAADFALGINLSGNTFTPQYQQALKVAELNKQLQGKVKQFRDFRLMEKMKYYQNPDGTYPNKKMKKIKDKDGKDISVVDEEWEEKFLKKAEAIPSLLKEIKIFTDKIYEINKPLKHRYVINKD